MTGQAEVNHICYNSFPRGFLFPHQTLELLIEGLEDSLKTKTTDIS